MSLVNLINQLNFFKTIYLALKHINCCYIINIKLHKNSTHDVSKIFECLTLVSFYIIQLCAAIKSYFDEKINFKHNKKSVLKDIFSLAHHVWAENCTQSQSVKKNQTFFKFLNVLADEIEQLKEKIKIFNIQIMITNNHIINISDDEKMILADNTKSFLIITDYIKIINDDFYNEIDSILCISISVWLYISLSLILFFQLLMFLSCESVINLFSWDQKCLISRRKIDNRFTR